MDRLGANLAARRVCSSTDTASARTQQQPRERRLDQNQDAQCINVHATLQALATCMWQCKLIIVHATIASTFHPHTAVLLRELHNVLEKEVRHGEGKPWDGKSCTALKIRRKDVRVNRGRHLKHQPQEQRRAPIISHKFISLNTAFPICYAILMRNHHIIIGNVVETPETPTMISRKSGRFARSSFRIISRKSASTPRS